MARSRRQRDDARDYERGETVSAFLGSVGVLIIKFRQVREGAIEKDDLQGGLAGLGPVVDDFDVQLEVLVDVRGRAVWRCQFDLLGDREIGITWVRRIVLDYAADAGGAVGAVAELGGAATTSE
jgi:hypothetical protein